MSPISAFREYPARASLDTIYMEPDQAVAAPLQAGGKFPESGAQHAGVGFASALAHRLSADVFR